MRISPSGNSVPVVRKDVKNARDRNGSVFMDKVYVIGFDFWWSIVGMFEDQTKGKVLDVPFSNTIPICETKVH